MSSFAAESAASSVDPPAALPISYRLVSSYEEMNPRRRSTMEDVHRVVPALGGDASMSYFGVYDGHGGQCLSMLYLYDAMV